MLNNAFTHLFTDRPFSHRMRLIWMVLFIISPVAYLMGVVIIVKTDPNARVGLEINRREAILTASRYAAETFGLDVTRWSTGVRIEVNNDRYYYYRLRQDDEASMIARIRRFAPEASVNVLFASPGNKEKLSVSLAPDGRPLGFSRTLSSDQEIVNLDEPAARALAAQTFQALQRERLGDFPAPANQPLLREERKFNGVVRSYDWR